MTETRVRVRVWIVVHPSDILQALSAGKIFAQISESSPVFAQPAALGDVNLVTVTMRANKQLQACETALYKPDPASQATWITDARSLSV